MATLAWLSVRPKAKLVIHWLSDIVEQKITYFFFKPLEYMLLKSAAKIIVMSPPYLESSVPLKKFTDKCEVFPIGIQLDYINNNISLTNKLHEEFLGKSVIFSLGLNTAYKGYEYLVTAMDFLERDCILVIAGKGIKNDSSLLSLVQKHNGRVFLLYSIKESDLGSYYAAAEIFVLPSVSRNEAFGIVQVEATFSQLPVVSTRIPGLTVEPRNALELARAINVLLRDKILAKKYGKNGRNILALVQHAILAWRSRTKTMTKCSYTTHKRKIKVKPRDIPDSGCKINKSPSVLAQRLFVGNPRCKFSQDSLIKAFYLSVLLGCARTNQMMLDCAFFQNLFKGGELRAFSSIWMQKRNEMICKFRSIICLHKLWHIYLFMKFFSVSVQSRPWHRGVPPMQAVSDGASWTYFLVRVN